MQKWKSQSFFSQIVLVAYIRHPCKSITRQCCSCLVKITVYFYICHSLWFINRWDTITGAVLQCFTQPLKKNEFGRRNWISAAIQLVSNFKAKKRCSSRQLLPRTRFCTPFISYQWRWGKHVGGSATLWWLAKRCKPSIVQLEEPKGRIYSNFVWTNLYAGWHWTHNFCTWAVGFGPEILELGTQSLLADYYILRLKLAIISL